MLHDKRPPLWFPILGTGFVTTCAYSSVMIWAVAIAHPLPREVAASVALGAAAVAAMVFGVAWCGLTVTVIDNNARPPTPTDSRQQAAPVADGFRSLDQEAPATFRPKLAFLPMANGFTAALTVTPEQLAELRRRVATSKLGLPVNGLQKFTSTEAKKLREEAEEKQLACVKNGNQLEWTQEAAAALLRASPAPLMRV